MSAMLRCLHCNGEFRSGRGLTNHRTRNPACQAAYHQTLGLGMSQSDSSIDVTDTNSGNPSNASDNRQSRRIIAARAKQSSTEESQVVHPPPEDVDWEANDEHEPDEEPEDEFNAVSYTHLTLPTKRIV